MRLGAHRLFGPHLYHRYWPGSVRRGIPGRVIVDLWSFLALVSTLAVLIVVHLATLSSILMADLPRHLRALAVLPPLMPMVAWRAGRRGAVVIWGCLVVTYIVLYFAV